MPKVLLCIREAKTSMLAMLSYLVQHVRRRTSRSEISLLARPASLVVGLLAPHSVHNLRGR